ncbi:MAG TPA: ribonuclease J, partial [Anaerolineae bacterium]|nr:ribonuclease J [Anaerolineae bacterium]
AGSGIGDVGPSVLRDREILSSYGFVSVAFAWSFATRELTSEPEIVSRGFVYEKEAGELLRAAQEKLTAALRGTSRVSKRGLDEVTRETLSRYFYDRTGRKPLIVTTILEA